MRNFSQMGTKGASSRWSKMTKEERSAEMSRRRRKGYEESSTKVKISGEEIKQQESSLA